MEKTFIYPRAYLLILFIFPFLSSYAQTPIYQSDTIARGLIRPYSVFADKAGTVFFTDGNTVRFINYNSSPDPGTKAGTGIAGSAGDGGPATNAQLDQPFGLFEDPLGNLYVGTRGDNRIRRIDTAGKITTFAGNGTAGYSGDHGPAISASLAGISGLWGDAKGNIYVSDSIHSVVRKIDTTGTITTFAGTGVTGYAGNGGPATAALLGRPNGISGDSYGNIYIGDDWINSIRKVDSAGTITTVLGGIASRGFTSYEARPDSLQFGYISNVFSDALGDLYVMDSWTKSIIQYNQPNKEYFWFFVTDSNSDLSRIPATPSISMDLAGNFYFADTAGGTVYRGLSFYPVNYSATNVVQQYIPKPYSPHYSSSYYQTSVTNGENFTRILQLFPTGDPATLLSGLCTFTSYIDPQITTYNGIPIMPIHYEIKTPPGEDSARDSLGIYLPSSLIDLYNNYIRQQHLSTPPVGENCDRFSCNYIVDTSIHVLEFIGDGNTIDHPSGPVVQIQTGAWGGYGSAPGFAPPVVYYEAFIPMLPGARNFYFTTGAIDVPLPLTLLSFTGMMQGSDGLLKWKTSHEINTRDFILERSGDSSAFTPIGVVKALSSPGDHSYDFTDKGLTAGSWYYRLKMEDIDGQSTYSPVVVLQVNLAGGFKIYPNPAKNILYVQLPAVVGGRVVVQLTDLRGAVLQQKDISPHPGATIIPLDISTLAAGSYFITTSSSGQKKVSLFVKE